MSRGYGVAECVTNLNQDKKAIKHIKKCTNSQGLKYKQMSSRGGKESVEIPQSGLFLSSFNCLLSTFNPLLLDATGRNAIARNVFTLATTVPTLVPTQKQKLVWQH